MKKLLCTLLSFGVLYTSNAQRFFIKNVTVIDTRNGKALPGKDVLIENGLIQSISNNNRKNELANFPVVDGTGKFLVPGLADAHIHFFQSGSLYTRPDAVDLRKKVPYEKEIKFTSENVTDYLQRYLRLGITSVIDVGGPFANFTIRDSTSKTITAPNILVTGPLFSRHTPNRKKGNGYYAG